MTLGFSTLSLHAGHSGDPATGSRAVPIYQTTSFLFDSVDHAASLFSLEQEGHIYSRITNPTVEVLEKRLAALEGGSSALALSSGQAAIAMAIMNLSGAGDNLVSSVQLYGGTYNLFTETLPRFGITSRFADPTSPESFEPLIDDRTKALYVETLGNPKNRLACIEELAILAHEHGLPLIVDNTVTTPYLLRPFDYGADIVVHSLTKFIGGHGTAIGGVIVEKGDFNWASGRFPGFTTPDSSYGGICYWEALGRAGSGGTAFTAKARVQLLRDFGPCLAPLNAFLFLQGLETLSLRMDKHCANALAVARWLREHPAVAWVNYPGLEEHPDYRKQQHLLPHGAGAILGFGVKGGFAAGVKLIESLELISHLANIGDARTLIIHPASTTHRQLTSGERLQTGVTEDYLRLSVGLEDSSDIIADLDQALRSGYPPLQQRSDER